MSLPTQFERIGPCGHTGHTDKSIVMLKEALSIAWEALEEHPGCRWPKEVMRRIEELAK